MNAPAPTTSLPTRNDREQLILEHYPLVRTIASRMIRRFPSSVELEELVNVGTLGLIDAVDRFEENRSISFRAYARIRVQGAILDELRKEDWVPRSVRDRHHRLLKSRDGLREKLGREPSHAELAENMDVSVPRLRELIAESTVRTLVSMEDKTGSSEETVSSILRFEGDGPVDQAVRGRLAETVRLALQDLPEREQTIVRLYYYEDLTFSEIGQTLGVTESRVSQLHSRMKRRLFSRLQELMED